MSDEKSNKKMIGKKRKKNEKEKSQTKDNSKEKTKENSGENRGRKSKKMESHELEEIIKDIEKEMNSYKIAIDLNDEYFIPYSKVIMSDLKFDKQISKMIKVYIYKLNQEGKCGTIKDFSRKMKQIVSFLHMNENEFSFFTILCDKIGFQPVKDFEFFEHLYYIGILSMQYSKNKYKNNIDDKYNSWKNEIAIEDKTLNEIDIREVNNRREELTLDDNELNKEEYTDYNQMVDDILKDAHFYFYQDKKEEKGKKGKEKEK